MGDLVLRASAQCRGRGRARALEAGYPVIASASTHLAAVPQVGANRLWFRSIAALDSLYEIWIQYI
jgi:hypothetical protein